MKYFTTQAGKMLLKTINLTLKGLHNHLGTEIDKKKMRVKANKTISHFPDRNRKR